MSLIAFSVLMAVAASIEESIERRRQRAFWARRRARRYTFN